MDNHNHNYHTRLNPNATSRTACTSPSAGDSPSAGAHNTLHATSRAAGISPSAGVPQSAGAHNTSLFSANWSNYHHPTQTQRPSGQIPTQTTDFGNLTPEQYYYMSQLSALNQNKTGLSEMAWDGAGDLESNRSRVFPGQGSVTPDHAKVQHRNISIHKPKIQSMDKEARDLENTLHTNTTSGSDESSSIETTMPDGATGIEPIPEGLDDKFLQSYVETAIKKGLVNEDDMNKHIYGAVKSFINETVASKNSKNGVVPKNPQHGSQHGQTPGANSADLADSHVNNQSLHPIRQTDFSQQQSDTPHGNTTSGQPHVNDPSFQPPRQTDFSQNQSVITHSNANNPTGQPHVNATSPTGQPHVNQSFVPSRQMDFSQNQNGTPHGNTTSPTGHPHGQDRPPHSSEQTTVSQNKPVYGPMQASHSILPQIGT